jgi:hypothetical protein
MQLVVHRTGSHLLGIYIRGIYVVERWECDLSHVGNDAKVTSNNGHHAEELYSRLKIPMQTTGIVPGPIKCSKLSADSMHLAPLGRFARSLGVVR